MRISPLEAVKITTPFILWLAEEDYVLPESIRAQINALTRKVTMSDEELAKALNKAMPRELPWSDSNVPLHDVAEFVKDLRDRYEERGKYEVKP